MDTDERFCPDRREAEAVPAFWTHERGANAADAEALRAVLPWACVKGRLPAITVLLEGSAYGVVAATLLGDAATALGVSMPGDRTL